MQYNRLPGALNVHHAVVIPRTRASAKLIQIETGRWWGSNLGSVTAITLVFSPTLRPAECGEVQALPGFRAVILAVLALSILRFTIRWTAASPASFASHVTFGSGPVTRGTHCQVARPQRWTDWDRARDGSYHPLLSIVR